MKPHHYQGLDRRTSHEKLIDGFLEKIQADLMPDKAEMVVAINTSTGDYVLGSDSGEAFRKYMKRWPHGGFFMCRVDGSPSGRM